MRPRSIAFVTEAEQWMLDPDAAGEDRWLPGLFDAHVETEGDGGADLGEQLRQPLPVAEAIAWARERADGVYIRDGDEREFGIGTALEQPGAADADEEDDEPLAPWRDELAAGYVRRRPADERWKDRGPGHPPIAPLRARLTPPAGWEVDWSALPAGQPRPDIQVADFFDQT
ncbi:hypothetical protein Q5424_08770 [Conexibacter sp. JD483]|uniref:hypothetical protein n=1 Tax=unclassified Conexibacter TaxID=2627773 RepID=UPI00271A7358|nr:MULTISPECIES: hypothetical protein [unclassified Conexibacter]MDO8186411.1 hypothetical protein [Conexibacter sp. CPCC 205706]MDO8199810.1 hypothetical protein [Conexibacter sp. CPCC 205762]MDR9369170.1 hypothetical protein [Conexibacter sp. JD483]